MLTEQDLAIIDKLHHSIMRQIFMYNQLVKKIPGSRVYRLIKKEILDHQDFVLQPLMFDFGKICRSCVHKKRTSVLFTNYAAQIMKLSDLGVEHNYSKISNTVRPMINRELVHARM